MLAIAGRARSEIAIAVKSINVIFPVDFMEILLCLLVNAGFVESFQLSVEQEPCQSPFFCISFKFIVLKCLWAFGIVLCFDKLRIVRQDCRKKKTKIRKAGEHMIVGVVKETKVEEYRVAMTPAGVEVMHRHGHEVVIQRGAGIGSGFEDDDYAGAGAEILETARDIYDRSGMVMRVKEPEPAEWELIRPGQIVFTYFHLAANEALTRALIKTRSVNIAYETIQKDGGSLPLLTPMSEVAGRMSIQQAAKYLEKETGGRGVLLGGVPGVEPATVLIIGGGVVGVNAAKMACGLGARVYLLDKDLDRLRYLSDVMPANCVLLVSTRDNIRTLVKKADVVVGAVLVHGARAPKLVTREMVGTMKKGSVMVDVAIDQGGCFDTSRATTHKDPVFSVDGVIQYCVANMPGAVPITSTLALSNATLPYALEIADKGWQRAMYENREILWGANVIDGQITFKGVADAFGLPFTSVDAFL
jgi:alanine dehydrogenase